MRVKMTNSIDIKNIRQDLLQLDSAAISDAMDSLNLQGALLNIKARIKQVKMIGPAFTVKYENIDAKPDSQLNAGTYIDMVPAGAVIVIDGNQRADCTNWGNILTHKALQQKISVTVIAGSVRDIEEIRELRYPLFSSHIYMVTGKNRTRVQSLQKPVTIADVKIRPDDWLFGDENGVLVLPKEHLTEIIQRALNVQKTENDIIKAIYSGSSLESARLQHGYAAPWVSSNEK